MVEGFGRILKGSGRGPERTEAARPVIAGLVTEEVVAGVFRDGLDGSVSGGGVGGNIFLFTGGSDC